MARNVTDAAILLGALESTAPDPHDAANEHVPSAARPRHTKFLKTDALKGARIGITRMYFYDSGAAGRGGGRGAAG